MKPECEHGKTNRIEWTKVLKRMRALEVEHKTISETTVKRATFTFRPASFSTMQWCLVTNNNLQGVPHHSPGRLNLFLSYRAWHLLILFRVGFLP